MKTITINVSEPVYADFKEYAERSDRTASELIREAMEEYHANRIRSRTSLWEAQPVSLGRVLEPLSEHDDFFDEMIGHAGR